jgi:starch synthase
LNRFLPIEYDQEKHEGILVVKKLKVCLVASEMVPFAKTGGLADVCGALAKYLTKLGHDVRLIMPFYSVISKRSYAFKAVDFAQDCEIWFGSRQYFYDVFTTNLRDSGAKYYFIHCPQLYDRWSIYTNDADEHVRFAMLSRAAIELCQRMQWAPDIIHCNDWQTALLPLYLKTIYYWDKFLHNTRTVFTIHNIGYQGKFPAHVINELNLNSYHHWFDASDLYFGSLNFLRAGIIHADKITTVSETYAKEIQSEYFGEGLQTTLHTRTSDLTGIINGVDYEEWDPETDKYIPYTYSSSEVSGKEYDKRELLWQLGLKYDPDAPVLSMITRLAWQKGIELLYDCLPRILSSDDVRFIALGSGEHEYEQFLFHLQLQFPDKAVFYRGYNYELSHLLEAGADIFLMPSKYEPCGLNQIYSLKYGNVPVVRKTGGLADTVELYDWQKQTGTGFVFEHYNSDSLNWALEYAITTFRHKESWKKLMIRAMQQDFSWEKQVQKYVELYQSMLA